MSKFSFDRSISSYSKIQGLVSGWRRNRPTQAKVTRLTGLRYLDLGCGPNIHPEFVNVDYQWKPGVDVCWDIREPLPFPHGRFQGIFSEHCLEHFPLEVGRRILGEARRVLQPGGRVRIVVPDAELYLRTYLSRIEGYPSPPFPYESSEVGNSLWTPLWSVNRIYYQDRESLFGHRCMFDFDLLEKALASVGFRDITKCTFGQGSDPSLLIDQESRSVESLYVEAVA